MSGWRDHIAQWLERPDDKYLAEKLARAIEDAPAWSTQVEVLAALRDYRAANPRQGE